MFIVKKNKIKIILFISLFCFLLLTNFFSNFFNIIKFDYDQRIIKVYGYCSKESIGYLNYLKNKYKFNKNIKVINYVHAANVSWILTIPKKINDYSDELILLNYPGATVKVRLQNISINEYNVNNFYFFLDKIDNSNYLEIDKINIEDLTNPQLEIFFNDSTGKTFRRIKITNYEFYQNKIIYPLNINFKELQNLFSIIFKFSNINIKKDSELIFIAKNKYIISNYKILDKYEKCYYIKIK